MKIEERHHASIVILRPVGRIDSLSSAEFQARLVAAVTPGSNDCIVDFAAVEFISSAGLRAIVAGARAKPRSRQLAVAAANAVVTEILKVSRFSHIVPIFATVAEAAAALLAPPSPHAAPVRPQPAPAPAAAAPEGSLTVRFWGTRGSLPSPLQARGVRAKIREAVVAALAHGPATSEEIDAFIDGVLPFSVRGTYGGNSSCVELVTGGEDYVLCDLGTGVREFGRRVLAEQGADRKHCFHVFQSHLHWDHIMGFPFFAPANIPGNVIRIYGCHGNLQEALRRQQAPPSYAVDFDAFQATIEFVTLEPGRTVDIAGFSVTPQRHLHAGDSFGYRFTRGDKTVVYSTDCEHKYLQLDNSYPFIEFYHNADLLIFDAMYSLEDQISVKEDQGHSSNIVAVELAQAARVKRLALFHHEPACDDEMIDQTLAGAIRFEEIGRRSHRVEVIAAYDGLELTV